MGVRFDTGIRIVILFILPSSYFTQENICPTSSGEKVVHVCESNFATGTSIYLDTFKAVDYQGSCACTLRAQGGAVDFQLSVQGVHTDCDATLYFPAPIDHTYNCVDKTPSTTTGRIASGQILFISLTKNSDVADFCVHLVQTSSAGSLNVMCSQGTLKPTTTITTTTITPPPAVTSSPTTSIENACQSESGDKVVHMCERKFGSGASIYLDTAKAVNYEGRCVCQLRAQGGAVDLQVTVQGASTGCDATLYFSPSIDHTYNCADTTPSTTTGQIESGQMVFLTLTKSSDSADFCVHLVQTSTGAGSLNLACSSGTLKSTTSPITTPSTTTINDDGVTTSDTSVTVSIGPSTTSPDNPVTESKGLSTTSPNNTTASNGPSTTSPDDTVTESKDTSTTSTADTTENQNITSSGRTSVINAETPQSVIVVSFVVVGVFAAVVVVMILFGLFTYCRDKSRLEKLMAANEHTNV